MFLVVRMDQLGEGTHKTDERQPGAGSLFPRTLIVQMAYHRVALASRFFQFLLI
jgi:hypothetical protein